MKKRRTNSPCVEKASTDIESLSSVNKTVDSEQGIASSEFIEVNMMYYVDDLCARRETLNLLFVNG